MGSIKALTDSPSTIDNDNPIKHDHNSAVDGEIQLNTTKESKKKKIRYKNNRNYSAHSEPSPQCGPQPGTLCILHEPSRTHI